MNCKCVLSDVCKYREAIINGVRMVIEPRYGEGSEKWDKVSTMIVGICRFRKPLARKMVILSGDDYIASLNVNLNVILTGNHEGDPKYQNNALFLISDKPCTKDHVLCVPVEFDDGRYFFADTDGAAMSLPRSYFTRLSNHLQPYR